jgi:hypothetical protein
MHMMGDSGFARFHRQMMRGVERPHLRFLIDWCVSGTDIA